MLVSLTLVTWLFTIVSYVVAAPLFVREPLLATTGHRASPAAGPPDFSQFARYNVLWGRYVLHLSHHATLALNGAAPRDANVASNSVVPGRIWHAIGSLGAGAPTLTPAMEQGWGSS